MRRPFAQGFWVGVFGALGVFDIWCAWNRTEGDSLSECARSLFRTHTPAGRAAFVAGWAALTVWLVPHICRTLKES